MSSPDVGESIPPHTPHAVSVSLPSWKANVGYEESQEWVVSKMQTGYPRFFINKHIATFAEDIIKRHGCMGQQAMLFPSPRTAAGCMAFISARSPSACSRLLNLVLDEEHNNSTTIAKLAPRISAVIFTEEHYPIAKQYWQHTGDGISSRRAEFCHMLFQEELLVPITSEPTMMSPHMKKRACKGPKRYQRGHSKVDHGTVDNDSDGTRQLNGTSDAEARESDQFVEERFGRNLDVSLVQNARLAIQRRIAGSLVGEMDADSSTSFKPQPKSCDLRGAKGPSSQDVYLYPCGMNAIFHTHQLLLHTGGALPSIVFGFPYIDTLKIVEKFGPGCLFYGHGSSEDLDNLELRLKNGEKFLALFCEFPGNPLLSTPDLERIRLLADVYDFAVVVDETIGNFINVDVLPLADVLVSSLTKVFTGECNVMGGSTILNPNGTRYQILKEGITNLYEDNYWPEDVVFMERNSRDFVSRIMRINRNAEMLCTVLKGHPSVKCIYYPQHVSSKPYYDARRTAKGGYGGLLSITFQKQSQAIAFFDRVDTAKGPSLGTNFTLTSPYVILAHYQELDWAAQYGVESHLIRVSVGLEDPERLRKIFEDGLRAVEEQPS